MAKRKKILIGGLLAVFLLIAGGGCYLYLKLFSPFFDTEQPVYVYVDGRKDFNDLLLQLQLQAEMKDAGLFRKLAVATGYPDKMKTGRYEISRNMSCRQFLQNLLRGNQSPCKVTFNNIRFKSELAENIGSQLMFGPGGLSQKLDDSVVCRSYGFDLQTIQSMFIPNTYEVYWNIPVERFLDRMKKEYDRFWDAGRLEKAAAIPLSKEQAINLASIVDEEPAVPDEYPVVAGLYINRLKQGMLLQADPTVKYAVGDFSLKRILDVHLTIDSPYNTYKHAGLPPGPIRVPSIRGIDAVLNYTKHHYLYMCAKEDFSGRHNFAATLAEHNRNAQRYRAALNRNNIY